MKDFLGRRIKVGDTLVYPVRRKSAMWLSSIVVTDLAVAFSTVYGTNRKGRRIKLSKLNRTVIIRN